MEPTRTKREKFVYDRSSCRDHSTNRTRPRDLPPRQFPLNQWNWRGGPGRVALNFPISQSRPQRNPSKRSALAAVKSREASGADASAPLSISQKFIKNARLARHSLGGGGNPSKSSQVQPSPSQDFPGSQPPPPADAGDGCPSPGGRHAVAIKPKTIKKCP